MVEEPRRRSPAAVDDGAVGPAAAVPEPRRWAVLAVALAGAFLILLDSTIVNVAIPSIQRDLRAGNATIEWVVSGYALAFGLALIPAGRLGERFGHRRLFLISLGGFTLASLWCGVAGNGALLVVLRVLQGVMAGAMNPQILAIIQMAFAGSERGRAFAWYGVVTSVATMIGPTLGGALTTADLGGWAWRPIFLLNVPIGVVALPLAARLLTESRGRAGRLDLVGILLITTTSLAFTYPLVEGQRTGWPFSMTLMLACGPPLLGVFLLQQRATLRRGDIPLVDLRLFGYPGFAAGVGVGFCYYAGFSSILFGLSIFFQTGLGFSASEAGFILLSFAAGSAIAAMNSARIARRLGRTVLHLGAALVMVGLGVLLAVIRTTAPDPPGLLMAVPLFVAGIGSGLFIAPNVTIVLADVPLSHAGTGGGVLSTAHRLGSAVGVALVGMVMFGSLGERPGRLDYLAAIQPAIWYAIAAVGLAFFLAFLLPARHR